MEFLQKYLYGVFELSLPKNARKRTKKKSAGGWVWDIANVRGGPSNLFLATSFVLSRFRVFLSDGSSKTLQKTFYKKKSCRKVFTKKSTKIPKPTFSRFF
jgi:hypothetical protein